MVRARFMAVLVLLVPVAPALALSPGLQEVQRLISDLKPAVTLHLGKTADWVVVTADAVWSGSTSPNAVHRIDPKTNRETRQVDLPGEPCADIAAGFGALWIPLCGDRPMLAKISLKTQRLTAVFPLPTKAESGIATGGGSVWLVIDATGSLARIDPANGRIRQTIQIAPGSYNPIYSQGIVYVTNVEGASVTAVDARNGRIRFTAPTGPNPRFLVVGAGAVWTLNQGDGSLTRTSQKQPGVSVSIPLGTPGHGGYVAFGMGRVWTTMMGFPLTAVDPGANRVLRQWVGPGGDSLAIGHGAVWLTNYRLGTISRIPLADAIAP